MDEHEVNGDCPVNETTGNRYGELFGIYDATNRELLDLRGGEEVEVANSNERESNSDEDSNDLLRGLETGIENPEMTRINQEFEDISLTLLDQYNSMLTSLEITNSDIDRFRRLYREKRGELRDFMNEHENKAFFKELFDSNPNATVRIPDWRAHRVQNIYRALWRSQVNREGKNDEMADGVARLQLNKMTSNPLVFFEIGRNPESGDEIRSISDSRLRADLRERKHETHIRETARRVVEQLEKDIERIPGVEITEALDASLPVDIPLLPDMNGEQNPGDIEVSARGTMQLAGEIAQYTLPGLGTWNLSKTAYNQLMSGQIGIGLITATGAMVMLVADIAFGAAVATGVLAPAAVAARGLLGLAVGGVVRLATSLITRAAVGLAEGVTSQVDMLYPLELNRTHRFNRRMDHDSDCIEE